MPSVGHSLGTVDPTKGSTLLLRVRRRLCSRSALLFGRGRLRRGRALPSSGGLLRGCCGSDSLLGRLTSEPSASPADNRQQDDDGNDRDRNVPRVHHVTLIRSSSHFSVLGTGNPPCGSVAGVQQVVCLAGPSSGRGEVARKGSECLMHKSGRINEGAQHKFLPRLPCARKRMP